MISECLAWTCLPSWGLLAVTFLVILPSLLSLSSTGASSLSRACQGMHTENGTTEYKYKFNCLEFLGHFQQQTNIFHRQIIHRDTCIVHTIFIAGVAPIIANVPHKLMCISSCAHVIIHKDLFSSFHNIISHKVAYCQGISTNWQ